MKSSDIQKKVSNAWHKVEDAVAHGASDLSREVSGIRHKVEDADLQKKISNAWHKAEHKWHKIEDKVVHGVSDLTHEVSDLLHTKMSSPPKYTHVSADSERTGGTALETPVNSMSTNLTASNASAASATTGEIEERLVSERSASVPNGEVDETMVCERSAFVPGIIPVRVDDKMVSERSTCLTSDKVDEPAVSERSVDVPGKMDRTVVRGRSDSASVGEVEGTMVSARSVTVATGEVEEPVTSATPAFVPGKVDEAGVGEGSASDTAGEVNGAMVSERSVTVTTDAVEEPVVSERSDFIPGRVDETMVKEGPAKEVNPEESWRAPQRMNLDTQVNMSMGGTTEIMLKDGHEMSGCLASPTSVAHDVQKLTLRLLCAKNLPAENGASLKIWVNDLEHIVSLAMEDANPVWGGPLYTFKFEADLIRDELVLEWQAYGLDGKVRLPALDILASANPTSGGKVNHWIKICSVGNARIQLRISPTLQDAALRPRETCPALSPGPTIPQDLQASYAMRKHILFGKGSPVILNVYDVSNSPSVATANEYLKSMGYGGLFHAAIQIHGREYSFGGTSHPQYNGTGIFTNPPKECTLHHYRESVYLGDCELSRIQVAMLLLSMKKDWKARSYNMISHNCCFFAQALAMELGVGDLPEWVNLLAQNAEGIEPTLLKINSYLKNQPNAKQKQQKGEQQAAKVKAQPEVHDAMLDHAMAAKIQRGYRRRKSLVNDSVKQPLEG